MSIDRSLKIKGALSRHRNVLSRVERIEQLKGEEKWQEGDSAFGLPKVGHRKSHAGKKEKAALKEAAAVGAEGVAATAEAPAAEPKKGEAKKPEAKKPEADKKAEKKTDKKK
jgi:small basic protein (TIGR04137 family)